MSGAISPAAFIGEGVELGEGVSIGPGAVILGPTVVEDGVWIGAGAQIGAPPEIASLNQNAAWSGDLQHAGVRLKRGAVIRELAVIHQGTHRPTVVGEQSWVLNRAYLAHDVQVGEHSTISGGVSVGGHCTIGARVNIGMNVSVHQRRVIASGAMIGMGTALTRDVPPFAKVYGVPPRLHGLNTVGLERAGYDARLAEALLAEYAQRGMLFLQGVPAALNPLAQVIEAWAANTELRPVSSGISETER